MISPLYGNETVVEYIKEKDHDTRLAMVLICFAFKLTGRLTERRVGQTNNSRTRLSSWAFYCTRRSTRCRHALSHHINPCSFIWTVKRDSRWQWIFSHLRLRPGIHHWTVRSHVYQDRWSLQMDCSRDHESTWGRHVSKQLQWLPYSRSKVMSTHLVWQFSKSI